MVLPNRLGVRPGKLAAEAEEKGQALIDGGNLFRRKIAKQAPDPARFCGLRCEPSIGIQDAIMYFH
jgi:hypothetical protein